MRKMLFDAVRMFGLAPMCALRFADGSGSGAGDGSSSDDVKSASGAADTNADGKSAGDGGSGDDEKKFTQADLDAEVTKRLTRAQKKWEREHNSQNQSTQQNTQQQTAGSGDGAQQQQAQQAQQPVKDDSAEKIAKANQRVVASEAKAAAVAAGVKPDKVDYVVRLADLSQVDVDEDDGPDTDAIKKAIDKVLKDLPEFKTANDDGKEGNSGFQIGADGSNQSTKAQTQQTQNSGAVKRWNRFRQ